MKKKNAFVEFILFGIKISIDKIMCSDYKLFIYYCHSQTSLTELSVLCVEGPDIKFKGVLHPLIISPTRVMELFEVTQTPQGG